MLSLSKHDRIVVKNTYGRIPPLPFICNSNYCFFDGLIDEYPYFSKYHSSASYYKTTYHIPCAILLNIL